MARWLATAAVVALVALAVVFVTLPMKQEARRPVTSAPPPPAAANGDRGPAPLAPPPPAARNGGSKKAARPPAAANGGARPTVLQTVYDVLVAPGAEKPDNALYSYALFPAAGPRAEAFLSVLLETTGDAASAAVAPRRLNVLYLPVQEPKLAAYRAAPAAQAARVLAREAYDYPRARAMLAGMCAETSRPLERFCAREPVRGPYVASFREAVSRRLADGRGAPVPVLMLDLSEVHEGAFATILAKYKDQVRRPDLPEPETINSLREKLLTITLEAADLIVPVRKAIADMIETAEAADGAGKKK